MDLNNKVCERFHSLEEVWRPKKSFVNEGKPLNKVVVAFVNPSDSPDKHENPSPSYSMTSKDPMENPRSEHAYIPGNIIRHLGMYHSQMTSHVTPTNLMTPTNHVTQKNHVSPVTAYEEDETISDHSFGDNSCEQGTISRTNILSHMAKNKTSWVEGTMQNRVQSAQRTSPILCKGKTLNSSQTPFEKSHKIKDNITKGVRDGKRFDLLPISRYLKQFHREQKHFRQERKFPAAVHISSYQRICFASFQMPFCYSSQDSRRRKENKTFFTERDVFKPKEARVEPTRGQALFVDPRIQLPNLYKKQYNAPVVRMRRELDFSAARAKVAFPVIA